MNEIPRQRYWFVAEPTGEVYAELLGMGIRHRWQPYLILRSLAELRGDRSEGVQPPEELEISREVVTSWPGTKLGGGDTAIMIRLLSDRRFLDWALSVTNGLYDWVDPSPLEDVGFLRTDRTVWLASIAHERDAFMDLTDEEYTSLLQECPGLEALLEQEHSTDGRPA